MNHEKELLKQLEELKEENMILKNQINNLKKSTFGWENLRYIIHEKLKTLNLEKNRPYDDFEGKLIYAVGQIIRIVFNLKFIKNLGSEHYEKAKEITDVIIKFAIDNFVIDDTYIARKVRGEIDERINN